MACATLTAVKSSLRYPLKNHIHNKGAYMKKTLYTITLLTSTLLATAAFAQTTPTIVTPPPTVNPNPISVPPNQSAPNYQQINQDERALGHEQLRDDQMSGQENRDTDKLNKLIANGQGNSPEAQKLQQQITNDQSRITANQAKMGSQARYMAIAAR